MRYLKKLTPLLLSIIFLIILSACGSSLEKPTGLEDSDKEATELVEKDNTDEKVKKDKPKSDKASSKDEEDKKDKKDKDKITEDKSSKDNKDKGSTSKSNESSNSKSSVEKKSLNNDSETKKSTTSKSSKSNKDSEKSSNKSNSKSSKDNNEKTVKNKSEKNQNSSKAPVKKEEKPKESKPKKEKPKVVQSIVISSGEVPLSATDTEIKEGDKPLDALIKITKSKGIQMDYTGSGGSAYVQGIANVYEFDRGQGSGWMYRINGVFPDRGVGAVPLRDGDRLEWLYTKDLGEDIGADLKPFRR